MRLTLVGDQFGQVLATFNKSAFRFEQQPRYTVAYEREIFARYQAGYRDPSPDVPILAGWLERIREQTRNGKTTSRVRIFEEPPTEYQEWLAYLSKWNEEAGEVIHYLTRSQARDAGLLPAAGDKDWWLFDDYLLMQMSYDGEGRRIHTELTDEEGKVQQARSWRDLAVRTAQKVSGK
jgi:NTP pyrophosphatase (non-canonical NTP hydrolase)